MQEESKFSQFTEKFVDFAAELGNQIYLRSLRDAFATIMPIFIVAGISVLVNNVIFPLFLTGDSLASAQVWGSVVTNGTLSVSGLLLAAAIGYCLAKNKEYKNPFAAAIISLSTLIIMMPINLELVTVGVRTFSWTDYAINPRLRLYSSGLIPPRDNLMRFSLYHLT